MKEMTATGRIPPSYLAVDARRVDRTGLFFEWFSDSVSATGVSDGASVTLAYDVANQYNPAPNWGGTPIYKADIQNGRPALRFTAASTDFLYKAISGGVSIANGATVAFAAVIGTDPTAGSWVGCAEIGLLLNMRKRTAAQGVSDDGWQAMVQINGGSYPEVTMTQTIDKPAVAIVIGRMGGGLPSVACFNGHRKTGSVQSLTGYSASFAQLGRTENGVVNHDLLCTMAWNRALSDTEIEALQKSLIDAYAASSSFQNRLCFVGDSLTEGGGISSPTYAARYGYTESYPYQCAARLGSLISGWYGVNYGISGSAYTHGTAAYNLMTRLQAEAYDAINPHHQTVFCHVPPIYNQGVTLGSTAAEVWAMTVDYCNRIRTRGGKVALLTCPQSTGQSTKINAYNALALANWRSCSDGFAHAGGDSRLRDPSSSTYFADGTHLKTAGYSVLAAYAADAVRQAIAAPVPYVEAA